MRGKIRSDRPAVGEFLEQVADHRLDRGEDVVLLDEAHLDVELVELARRAVGARVLVAEARRDLEIAVEAGDHDQLLELLRRLRQRVELAGMQPRRHQEVAGAFRRRCGQDRRLELEEAGVAHPPPDRGDDLRALHDVVVELLAAEVEEAVFEPGFLGIFLIAEHRHRQFAAPPTSTSISRMKTSTAPVGRFGLIVSRGPRLDLAVDADDPFGAHLLGQPRRPANPGRRRTGSARNGREGR